MAQATCICIAALSNCEKYERYTCRNCGSYESTLDASRRVRSSESEEREKTENRTLLRKRDTEEQIVKKRG